MVDERAEYDVLVVGAGMTGLAAARVLSESGIRVLVLEARERVGGRILTERVGGEVIELGAEFVHGRPPELLALIEEAGLELVERSGSFVRHEDGRFVVDDDASDGDDPFTLLEELEGHKGPDCSFAEFLELRDIPPEARRAAISFVEGFNAADHRVISVAALGVQQKAEDAIAGYRSFHVAGGYDQLPVFLAKKVEEAGGELRTDAAVYRLKWEAGQVAAFTNQGTFTASKAVVALPLGVLQRGTVHLEPALPDEVSSVFAPAGPIRMGDALRFTMIFKERFWGGLPPQPAIGELSFLVSPESTPPVWWTPYPEKSSTLTGWIGGPRTAALAGLSAEGMAERAVAVLAKLFHVDAAHISELVLGCYTHDWASDPHSLGAYSYIAKGGLNASALLAEPLAQTIYFAGEHTTTDGHWGTVHAALTSGLRAARQIAAMKNSVTDAHAAGTVTKPLLAR